MSIPESKYQSALPDNFYDDTFFSSEVSVDGVPCPVVRVISMLGVRALVRCGFKPCCTFASSPLFQIHISLQIQTPGLVERSISAHDRPLQIPHNGEQDADTTVSA